MLTMARLTGGTERRGRYALLGVDGGAPSLVIRSMFTRNKEQKISLGVGGAELFSVPGRNNGYFGTPSIFTARGEKGLLLEFRVPVGIGRLHRSLVDAGFKAVPTTQEMVRRNVFKYVPLS